MAVQVKLRVTALLFQPAGFAAGVAVATIVSRPLSMLTFVVIDALLPALSVAVPETG